MKQQSWVTFASDDAEGGKALVLAKSLQHIITRRILSVVVSPDVSEEICDLLEFEFDRCIRLTRRHLQLHYPSLNFQSVAKLHCFQLQKLERFVFLHPDCIVLRHCDELFGYGETVGTVGKEIRILVGSPASKEKWIGQKKYFWKNEFEEREFFQNVSGLKEMDHNDRGGAYLSALNFRDGVLEGNGSEMSILHFVGAHPIGLLLSGENGTGLKKYCPEGTIQRVKEHATNNPASVDKPKFQAVWNTFLEHLQLEGGESPEWLKTICPTPHQYNKIERLLATQPTPVQHIAEISELKDSVAIVGIGLRLPQADNLEEFWDLLIHGKDGIRKVPPNRWTQDRCWNRPETTENTPAGFLKSPVDEIDGKFFGFSPMELSLMDPQQRLALQVLWEAMENAGTNPTGLRNTNAGVFGGAWRMDYQDMLLESGIVGNDFFRTYMGNSLGTLTGRISHVLELTGPSISTESGCSTSMVAVHMACKSLLNEECELALAFGVNLLLYPFGSGSDALSFLISSDGHCKTFDENADGFGRAEGCVALVLKRFPDAVRDGDNIHAVIRGSAAVQEGRSRSMGTPTVQCEALAMQLALKDAGVHPKDVSFVEAHGTGTAVGDPLEVSAICEAYGSQQRERPLVIGSAKTIVGHTEACSGITGIIKTVLAMKHGVIPPHRNLQSLNSSIDLDAIPATLPLTPTPWVRGSEEKPRIAGINSFGITGTDAHAILQESPDPRWLPKRSLLSWDPSATPPPMKIMKLAAKSPEAIQELKATMKSFLMKVNEEDVGDVCYSGNVGRGDFHYRTAFLGRNKAELLRSMQEAEVRQIPAESPKLCFLFTGQGSQYPNMARQLWQTYPVFRIHFDVCEKMLLRDYSISIKDAMWGKEQDNLSRTIYSQTSIFCVEYALFKLWESWGVTPDYVLGHSLGEFAAAVAAGILNFEDALKLVAERSRLIDSLPTGKMIVLKTNVEKTKELLEKASMTDWLDFAAINSSEQTVLAGTEDNVSKFADFCKNNDTKTTILASTHAFHSRMMDPILEQYKNFAESNVACKNRGRCVYVSGMEGRVLQDGEINADYWVRHTREAVQFTGASDAVFTAGVTNFLEVGPHPVLSALILHNADAVESLPDPVSCVPSLRRNEDELSTLLNGVGKLYSLGVPVKWDSFHAFSAGHKVQLPSYPFQNKAHWFEYPVDKQRALHPLLGTLLPTPTGVTLYQNHLDLARCSYLKDHMIGNTIIYPGAGYFEMCLVAGHAATQYLESAYSHPTAPISIQNFQISAPLALSKVEGERTELQTIVSGEEGATTITIYSKCTVEKQSRKWIHHASAQFLPYAISMDGATIEQDSLDSVLARCSEDVPGIAERIHQKLTSQGFNFGPAFRLPVSLWKGEGECIHKVKLGKHQDPYICHPTLIDAMIQAAGLLEDNCVFQVPVSVDSFIWFGPVGGSSTHCYIHNKSSLCTLYDEDGTVLAIMSGVHFVETSVAAVLAAVEAQRTTLPTMYEDVWRERLGPWERRIELPGSPQLSQMELEDIRSIAQLEQDELAVYSNINELCLLYFCQALLQLGWAPSEGDDAFTLEQLLVDLQIAPLHRLLVRQWLLEMAAEGWMSIVDGNAENISVRLENVPYDASTVSLKIQQLRAQLEELGNKELHLIGAMGEKYGEILQLKEGTTGLSVLFAGGDGGATSSSLEALYDDSIIFQKILRVGCSLLEKVLRELLSKQKRKDGILRILEVGGGTGLLTKTLLKMIQDDPSAFHYTFTDISPAFFPRAERLLEENKMQSSCRVLNIEEDPGAQGYIPHSYDLVIAGFVLHATEDIRVSLSNCRKLLRERGHIFLVESTNPLRINLLTFGTLEGYWRFKDRALRPYNCEMPVEQWESVMRETGFHKTVSFSAVYDKGAGILGEAASSSGIWQQQQHLTIEKNNWIMLANNNSRLARRLVEKLGNAGRSVKIIEASDKLQLGNAKEKENELAPMLNNFYPEIQKGLEGILYLWGCFEDDKVEAEDPFLICKHFLALCKDVAVASKLQLVVVTRGVVGVAEDDEIRSPYPSTLWGIASTLQNENRNIICKCVDVGTNSVGAAVDNVFAELFTPDSETYVSYRGEVRRVNRIIPYKLPINRRLPFPKVERTRLILPASNAVRDLKFAPAPTPTASLGDYEVEVQVEAYGLNFKDLLIVLNPDNAFEHDKTVGLDFAGKVVGTGSHVTRHKIGDYVCGLNLNGEAIPSHIRLKEGLLLGVPGWMSSWEAATLPTVAATASLCLLNIAQIREGDNVLIHTGSGGVGLVAIQLAQARGCNILATAGNPRKRKYLRSLGVQHVFNSRGTEYEAGIRAALGGNHVDVVLNSLTGEGFKEASLAVCAPGARFIEMSRLNIWTEEQVASLRPDIFYKIVDLSAATENEIQSYLEDMSRYLESSVISPIPSTRFDAADIREAFAFMQKAKHIGKIVLVMPEMVESVGTTVAWNSPLFNSQSTYLITGGLGGIGFEVAKWMLGLGAKNIILASRSPPKDKISEEIAKRNGEGNNLIPVSCDVGDPTAVTALLDWISSESVPLPPLRGIMHAAAGLSDASFDNQDWSAYQAVFNPKVVGAWNLHKLTTERCIPLEHFVNFSSVASIFGTPGQSSYVSANTFLDAFTHYRYSLGLPATTINWGQWGQVGMVAGVELKNLRPISTLAGLSSLEAILRCGKRQTVVVEANMQSIGKSHARAYFQEVTALKEEAGGGEGAQRNVDPSVVWRKYDDASSPEERVQVFKEFLSSVVAGILKLDEGVEGYKEFMEMGMDSLMMIEMKNVLQSVVGDRAKITVNNFKDCHTIDQMAGRIVQIISGEDEGVGLLSEEQFIQLIREDSVLPDSIQPPPPEASARLCPPSEISTVLITGVSGNLGPYVLWEIFKRPHIQKIYCLMKQSHLHMLPPKTRLSRMLEGKGLASQIRLDIVECLLGNLTQERCGLEPKLYEELCGKVDAIIHLGGGGKWGSSFEPYRKARHHSEHDLRTVNVIGTTNVLEFAVCGKLKHVYYASCLAASAKDGGLSETWPDFDQSPNDAYSVSKFVCEHRLATAAQRGVPVKVFRFPTIAGDSRRGGNVDFVNSQDILRFMSYMHLRMIPATAAPFMMVPVDTCAALSVDVFFKDDAGFEVYNVLTPYPADERDFVDISAELGHPLEVVGMDKFLDKLETVEDSELVVFLKRTFRESRWRDAFGSNLGAANLKADMFLSTKLEAHFPNKYPSCMETSSSVLKRDLWYCKKSGILKKFGVE